MKESKIQTLHPEKGKRNQIIPVEKYEVVKTAILETLQTTELTHTQLMQALVKKLKGSFKDNILWYGITVKLDLEARKLIKRTTDKTPVYKLVKKLA